MFEPPEYIRLSEAAKTFCHSEDSLIAAGIEGQLRVYFLLGEDRLAVRLRANPDGTIARIGEEPQRKHFIYIPVSRRDLASALNGEVGTDVPAFTRPDKDGAYWAPCWEKGGDGEVIPMPVVTRTGLFVRRSDLGTNDRQGSAPEELNPSIPAASPPPHSLVTSKRLSEVFPHPKNTNPENWSRTISECPGWMKTAREYTPGRGGGRRALWNPAQFAICMVSKGFLTEHAARIIISRNFPEWDDRWSELTALL